MIPGYCTKYYTSFADRQGIVYKVELMLKGYLEAPTEWAYTTGSNPVVKQVRGDKEGTRFIYQTECTVNFIIREQDTDVNDILEADKYDWILQVTRGPLDEVYFIGFVDPVGTNRQYKGNNWTFSIYAADGLNELNKIEFTDDDDDVFTDRQTILSVVKNALKKINLPLDFEIKLNVQETALMSATDNALHVTTVDTRRFLKTVDGRQTSEKCDYVLREVLKEFRVEFRQENGRWSIRNYDEGISPLDLFAWEDLTLITRQTYHDPFIPVDQLYMTNKGNVEKLQPYKKARFTFRNKNQGDEYPIDPFVNNGFDSYSSGVDFVDAAMAPSDKAGGFTSDTFTVNILSNDDVIRISHTFKLNAAWGGGPESNQTMYWRVDLQDDLGNTIRTGYVNQFTTGVDTTVLTGKPLTDQFSGLPFGSADYRFEFFIYKEPTAPTLLAYDIEATDIRVTVEFNAGAVVTYDRLFEMVNIPSAHHLVFEDEVFFGDGIQENDIGNFKIGPDLTTNWNRWGKTDNLPILQISLLNFMNRRQRYRDYLTIEALDENRIIDTAGVLQIESKDYRIVGYTHDALKNKYGLNLEELIREEITQYNFNQVLLNTVDGEDMTGN